MIVEEVLIALTVNCSCVSSALFQVVCLVRECRAWWFSVRGQSALLLPAQPLIRVRW